MGMGNSDILIDLRQTEDIQTRYETVLEKIENDKDVVKYSPLITSKFEFITEDKMVESLLIETGDFDIFPLNYLEGDTPVLNNEIALSYLNAEEFGKKVGDSINVIVDGVETSLLVTGIYQDVTNGGKTAKANIRPNYETASWYMISVNISDGISVSEKMTDYTKMFNPAKVTDMEGYFRETFGNTINQLWSLTIIAMVIAIVVAIMITSLFLKMLIAKDISQIIIMKSIGFSVRDIQTQYIIKALLVLNSGIILGTVISNTLGQSLIGLLLSNVGVSNISFVINPVEAYVLSPLLLITVVSLTIWVSTKSIKTLSLSDLQVE
jgi:putative ABC transport system permease protein